MKIKEILKEYKIDFVESGKNVSKGNVNINCPMCGDDSSYHLGISPEKGVFSCWRNRSHKGSVSYLLSFILHISIDEAKILLEGNDFTFTKNITETIIGGKSSIDLPDNFRVIRNESATKPFYNYLINRGFDRIEELVERYDIKCCISGKWKDRVIFPLYLNSKLMTWQGRSIMLDPFLRYRDLEINESVRHVKYCLFDYDNLNGGDRLYIFEGVFDALKLSWYSPEQINSTCVFTLNITDEQVKFLLRISEKYDRLILLLDENAESQAMRISGKLSFIKNLEVKFTPLGFKDIGEMSGNDIKSLIGGHI
jgi:hypothetical protein